jgi:hypothetical protein
MVAEMGWRKGESDLWFDYRYNFLFWDSVEGSTVWLANVIAIVTLLMFLPGLVFALKKAGDERARLLRRVALFAIFSFFMATPLSKPIWDLTPMLKEVQFPWRWLSITSMAGSIALAASIPHWLEKRKSARPVALAAAACVLVAVAFVGLQTIRNASFIPRKTFDSMVANISTSRSLAAWLPIWARVQTRPMKGDVEIGGRPYSITRWEDCDRSFRVEGGQALEARLRTFYYPHWVATANGRTLETSADEDGALMVSIPPGDVSVGLQFREPVRVAVSSAVSLIGWVLIAGLCGPVFFKPAEA